MSLYRTGLASDGPDVALVADNVYLLRDAAGPIGFVERDGNMFIALEGENRSTAHEAGRSLSWDEAALMLQMAHNAPV